MKSPPQEPFPLDFNAFSKLPESHTWEPENLPDNPDPTGPLPEIDLLAPDVVSRVRSGCEEWGVFLVTSHGVPRDLLNRVERHSRRLFTLPTERKRQAARRPGGFSGYGAVRISAFFPKRMWSEGFSMVGSPVEHARLLWPLDHDDLDRDDHGQCYEFCNVMETYQKVMKALCEKLLDLMLRSLGPNPENSKWARPKNGGPTKPFQALLQLNSYPICPDPARAMGMGAHTDSSLLTVIHQSAIAAGLEIYRNDRWVPVKPVKGALVVNVGDLMHILSNGQFTSALHRAAVSGTHHRVSAAYFYGPPDDVVVGPLTGPPIYRAVTWREYLDAKATHFYGALNSIKNLR